MPGVVHEHDGILVYHRKDGALTFHKMRHSRHIPALDRKRGGKNRPPSRNYPQAGDGAPIHTGRKGRMKPRKIKGGGKRR